MPEPAPQRLPGYVNCKECGHFYSDHPLLHDRDGFQDGHCKHPVCKCQFFQCPHPTEFSWRVRVRRQIQLRCLCGLTCDVAAREGWLAFAGGGQHVKVEGDVDEWYDRLVRERPKVHCADWKPGDPEDRYHAPRCLEAPTQPEPRPKPEPPAEPEPSLTPLTPGQVAELVAELDAQELKAFRDPDLTGSLLMFVLVVIRAKRSRIAIRTLQEMEDLTALWLGWDNKPLISGQPWKLSQVIANDAPRYEAPRSPYSFGTGPCEAPMKRRSGPCGQSSSSDLTVDEISPADGTIKHHYFCSRHKQESRACAAFTKTQPGERPTPRPNRGGVLMRHLPDWDWRALYSWAAPYWTPPRELFVDEDALKHLEQELFGSTEAGDA